MNKKAIIFIVIIAVIAAGSLFAWKEYNRPLADMKQVKTDITTTPAQMVTDFEENETLANGKYLGKTTELTGIVITIDRSGDSLVTVILGSKEAMHNVSCQLASAQSAGDVKEGDSVRVKGFTTGYLMDVELNRCIIEKIK